jgi:DegV family protein with EDD domain
LPANFSGGKNGAESSARRREMRDYVIVTDSTVDLPKSMVDSLELEIASLNYIIDGVERRDYEKEREFDAAGFYAQLRQGKRATTQQVPMERFQKIFQNVLDQGKDILYIAFSSSLSGSYATGVLVAKEMAAKNPEAKIIVIDTLAASMGEGLIVYYAAMMKKEGKSIDAVAKWVTDNRLRLCHWFTVDDLMYLKRGGRVSATAALVGTVLSIKPVLHVDNDGHLIPVTKVRGRKKSLDMLIERMEQTVENPEEQMIFICESDTIEDAKYVAEQVRLKFNVKGVTINSIGSVIGSHTGPGTIGLFFLGSER